MKGAFEQLAKTILITNLVQLRDVLVPNLFQDLNFQARTGKIILATKHTKR